MKASPVAKKEPPHFERWWVTALLAIWLIVGFIPKFDGNPGTFGDMFGMVNSLFSGLAFLGLIHTIRLQMHQIALQREDLELTRIELERSADAQTESAETLALQVIISAIGTQLATALQRRDAAKKAELDLNADLRAGLKDARTASGIRPIPEVITEMSDAIVSETKKIDALSKRLEDYEQRLTATLNAANAKRQETCLQRT
jgi:hypothetical protein